MNRNIESKAWPFIEAEKILKAIGGTTPSKGYVLFESGYGPSGLPHIGTFGEIVRTTMVRHAFSVLSDIPTKLFCISDDMDGMRKIPSTIPNQELYKQYLDLPLSVIPDPFGVDESFGAGMNGRMKRFLHRFGFDNEFISASECYNSGRFNDGLIAVINKYDAIMDIMLPTLGEERRKTYSPFLPVCDKTGRVLQAKVIRTDVTNNTIVYVHPETEEHCETSILNGKCKLQWKVDFGMRWALFDVDFEMYGKDHLSNGEIYTEICKVLGGKAPVQMFYELFLDRNGEKVSKSKGNNTIDIEEWLLYAPREVLAYFMYLSPQKAKRLHKEVVPKIVDEYLQHLFKYDETKMYDSPVYHVHAGAVETFALTDEERERLSDINYSLILNIVSVCNASSIDVVLSYFDKRGGIPSKLLPLFKSLVEGAINFYNDHIKPQRRFRSPDDTEMALLRDLRVKLEAYGEKFGANSDKMHVENTNLSAELQTLVFDVAKNNDVDPKSWFMTLYNVLFGAENGPRMGTFISLYGIKNVIAMIDEIL